jgi:hypothetical protein
MERRLIGGRVPVLLKLDGSRPSFHMWYDFFHYRTVSIITLPLARSSYRFNNAAEVRLSTSNPPEIRHVKRGLV